MNLNDIETVLVVGAGTMGHSIAQVYAQAGFSIILVDLNQKALDRAIKLIHSNLNTLAEFDIVETIEIPNIIARIQTTTNLISAAKSADFVTEAVNEIPEIKEKVFNQLSENCFEDVVLASNTSELDIFKIVKDIKNPKRLITHHWYAPPHIIPLVEVGVGRKTSKSVVDFSVELLKNVGKTPVVLEKFVPKYIVNKIQHAIGSVMYELIMRGVATPEQIDLAIKSSLGIRLPIVGIIQSQDFTGLDLVNDIIRNTGTKVPPIAEKVEKGHLGVKTGKGWYDYGDQTEDEILKKRDRLFLKNMKFLEKIDAFKPI